MKNIMYVAINKETGKVMTGAKGQHAYGDSSSLARSIGHAYSYTAMKAGCKPKDLYFIKEIVVDGTPEPPLEKGTLRTTVNVSCMVETADPQELEAYENLTEEGREKVFAEWGKELKENFESEYQARYIKTHFRLEKR